MSDTWFPFQCFDGTDLRKERSFLHRQVWPDGTELQHEFFHEKRRAADIDKVVAHLKQLIPTLCPSAADGERQLKEILRNMRRPDWEPWVRMSDNLDHWVISRKLSADGSLWQTELGQFIGPRLLPENPYLLEIQPLLQLENLRPQPPVLGSCQAANEWLRQQGCAIP